eukprot:4444561-Lingulodinium_polyedra.AAC.1
MWACRDGELGTPCQPDFEHVQRLLCAALADGAPQVLPAPDGKLVVRVVALHLPAHLRAVLGEGLAHVLHAPAQPTAEVPGQGRGSRTVRFLRHRLRLRLRRRTAGSAG